MTEILAGRRRLKVLLLIAAGGSVLLGTATLALATGVISESPFSHPLAAAYSIGGLSMLFLLSWFAAADVHRYRSMAYLLIWGLGFSALTLLLLLFSPSTNNNEPLYLIIDFVITLAVTIGLYVVSHTARLSQRTDDDFFEENQPPSVVTVWHRIGQIIFAIFGMINLVIAIMVIFFAFADVDSTITVLFEQPLTVSGVAVRGILMGICGLLSSHYLTRDSWLATKYITVVVMSLSITFVIALSIMPFAAVFQFSTPILAIQAMLGASLLNLILVLVFGVIQIRTTETETTQPAKVGYTPRERNLGRVLMTLSYASTLCILVTLVGAIGIFGSNKTFFTEPPFVSRTIAGLAVFGLLSWFAGSDIRRYRFMLKMLTGGFFFTTAVFAFNWLRPTDPSWIIAIRSGAIICFSLGLILLGALLVIKPAEWPYTLTHIVPVEEKPLGQWERNGRIILGVYALFSTSVAVFLLVLPYIIQPDVLAFLTQPLMVIGSVAARGFMGAIAFFIARDVRKRSNLITILILAHAAAFVAAPGIIVGTLRKDPTMMILSGFELTSLHVMLWLVALDLAFILGLRYMHIRMERELYSYFDFFSPVGMRSFEALTDSLIDGGLREVISPHQIVVNTDRYLSSFSSGRRALARLTINAFQWAPLLNFRPPLSHLNPAARQSFLTDRFKGRVNWFGLVLSDLPFYSEFLDFLAAGIRLCMNLTYVGYYSDPAVHEAIGYKRYSERPLRASLTHPEFKRQAPPLKVVTPEDILSNGHISSGQGGTPDIIQADIVIVGSGAAGSILAEQLLEKNPGRSILMLEKGKHIDPTDFNDDEALQLGKLYADGAFEQTRSLSFSVAQGSAVGGTTVVNNAVCFRTPEPLIEKWNTEWNTHIVPADYWTSQQDVWERLRVTRGDEAIVKNAGGLNPAYKVFEPGLRVLPEGSYTFDAVDINIDDCLGCGYCNIGCMFGRKLSMLDLVLPEMQKEYGARFQILAEANVIQLNGAGGHIDEVVVELPDNKRLTIKAETVIVSGGTIHSSWLLMRSGIGKGELPVGRGLSFNLGSPMHALFSEKEIDSYNGLQIAHYLALHDEDRFVYETWYNPPVTQALAMPGWLDTHFENMLRYRNMIAIGVLMGTEVNAQEDIGGHVQKALLLKGQPDVFYKPSSRDYDTLIDAFALLVNILLAAGADEVFLSTKDYRSYRRAGLGRSYSSEVEALSASGTHIFTPEGLKESLRKLVRTDGVLLASSHPQGGNRIGEPNGMEGGVVDENFKVHGFDNLFICDASVHPTATVVNPQLTVMTLAHYAAERITNLI